MKGITDGKLLANSRQLFKNRLRSATKGVKVFEKSTMHHLQIPQKTRGVVFMFQTILFIVFITSLTMVIIDEKQPVVSRSMYIELSVLGQRTGYRDVVTEAQLVDYLATLYSKDSIQDLFHETLRNRILGPIRILQVRTETMKECEHIPYGDQVKSAGGECLVVGKDKYQLTRPFFGERTGVEFTFDFEPPVCVGAVCANSMLSAVHPEKVDYGYGGYLLMLTKNGSLYTQNGTNLDAFTYKETPPSWMAAPIYSDGGTTRKNRDGANNTDPNTTSTGRRILSAETKKKPLYFNPTELMQDFVISDTRAVVVQITIFNAEHKAAAVANVIFEMPVSGGVFPFLEVKYFTFNAVSPFMWWYLWIYPVCNLSYVLLKLAMYIYRTNKKCVACTGGKGVVLVFHCLKCNCPNMVADHVTVCDSCGMPIPAIEHRCWRLLVFSPWSWLEVVCYVSLLISRSVSVTLSKSVKDEVLRVIGMDYLYQEAYENKEPGSPPESVSFEQKMMLSIQATNLATITIVATYVMLFRLVTRGRLNYRFMNVFEFSLRPLIFFSINFFITFVGFCLAFNILMGPWNSLYLTVPRALLTSFRTLLTNVDWREVELGVQFNAVPYGLMYMLFVVICVHLMFNVFPSILDVAYKKSVNTPYYDADVLSVWYLMKPLLRVFGMIGNDKTKRLEREKRAKMLKEQRKALSRANDEDGGSTDAPLLDTEDAAHNGANDGTAVDVADTEEEAERKREEERKAKKAAEDALQLRQLTEITDAIKRGEGIRDMENVQVARAVLAQATKSTKVVDLGSDGAAKQLEILLSRLNQLHAVLPRLVELAQERTKERQDARREEDRRRLDHLYLHQESPNEKAQRSVLESVQRRLQRQKDDEEAIIEKYTTPPRRRSQGNRDTKKKGNRTKHSDDLDEELDIELTETQLDLTAGRQRGLFPPAFEPLDAPEVDTEGSGSRETPTAAAAAGSGSQVMNRTRSDGLILRNYTGPSSTRMEGSGASPQCSRAGKGGEGDDSDDDLVVDSSGHVPRSRFDDKAPQKQAVADAMKEAKLATRNKGSDANVKKQRGERGELLFAGTKRGDVDHTDPASLSSPSVGTAVGSPTQQHVAANSTSSPLRKQAPYFHNINEHLLQLDDDCKQLSSRNAATPSPSPKKHPWTPGKRPGSGGAPLWPSPPPPPAGGL